MRKHPIAAFMVAVALFGVCRSSKAQQDSELPQAVYLDQDDAPGSEGAGDRKLLGQVTKTEATNASNASQNNQPEATGRQFDLERPVIGADISFVPSQEDRGSEFSDQGEKADILKILSDHQFNWIRLRLFVDPTAENGYSRQGVVEYKEHAKEVNEIVRDLPGNLGLGTFIWEATSSRWGGLFDRDGSTTEKIDIYPEFFNSFTSTESGEASTNAGSVFAADPPGIPDGWSDGYVYANGVRLHYYRAVAATEKQPLVMVHGITDNGLCWTTLALRLQDDYDIYMLDARGHGLSDPFTDSDDGDTLIKDVAAAVEALELKKPILMGRSRS